MQSTEDGAYIEHVYGLSIDADTARRLRDGARKMLAAAVPALMRAVPLDGYADAQEDSRA